MPTTPHLLNDSDIEGTWVDSQPGGVEMERKYEGGMVGMSRVRRVRNAMVPGLADLDRWPSLDNSLDARPFPRQTASSQSKYYCRSCTLSSMLLEIIECHCFSAFISFISYISERIEGNR